MTSEPGGSGHTDLLTYYHMSGIMRDRLEKEGRETMRLKPRYRITIDLPEEYARQLDAVMTAYDMTQSDVFRVALAEYYARHIGGDPHEAPTTGPGSPGGSGGV